RASRAARRRSLASPVFRTPSRLREPAPPPSRQERAPVLRPLLRLLPQSRRVPDPQRAPVLVPPPVLALVARGTELGLGRAPAARGTELARARQRAGARTGVRTAQERARAQVAARRPAAAWPQLGEGAIRRL